MGTSRRRPLRAIANVCIRIRIVLAGACLLLLASCASVPLGLQKDGTYVLEANEQSLDCDRLYKAIWGRVENMKTMPAKAKAELDQAPPTAFLAIGRIFGGQNKGLATIAEYDRESAHVGALHRTMNEKRCPNRLDLERELGETESAMSQLRQK
jgi:hypothetical protein